MITVTGLDKRTDPLALLSLDVELGLLYSTTSEGNRYPDRVWIEEMTTFLPNTAVHICGRGTRQELLEGKLDLIVGCAKRIQINGVVFATELVKLEAMYPEQAFITQHANYNHHLALYPSARHELLVDGSGGRGRTPTSWARPTTKKRVGFAGGLSPETLAKQLPLIHQAAAGADYWVDMEGRLRVEDWFSVERARQAVEVYEAFVSQCTLTGIT